MLCFITVFLYHKTTTFYVCINYYFTSRHVTVTCTINCITYYKEYKIAVDMKHCERHTRKDVHSKRHTCYIYHTQWQLSPVQATCIHVCIARCIHVEHMTCTNKTEGSLQYMYMWLYVLRWYKSCTVHSCVHLHKLKRAKQVREGEGVEGEGDECLEGLRGVNGRIEGEG